MKRSNPRAGFFPLPALAGILVALLLGFFTSIFPILAASSSPPSGIPGSNGGSILACVGNSQAGSGSITLGGRPVAPGNLLQVPSSGGCLANETGLDLQKGYLRTVLVSPVLNGDNSENPAAGGQALLNALAAITGANPAPSATNPYLLKLEPGIYNTGNQPLNLVPYVDLEGSGQDLTIINSTVDATALVPTEGAVVAASNSEVRSVKIVVNAPFSYGAALLVPVGITNFTVSQTTLQASGASGLNYALFNNGSTVLEKNSTASATGNNFLNFAVDNHGGTLTVQDSTILVTSTGFSEALLSEGPTTILNTAITATGGTNGYAINNAADPLIVRNSTLSASGASGDNVAINNGSGLTVEASTLTANGGTNVTTGIRNTGTAIVKSSNLVASGGTNDYGFYNYSGTAKIVFSELSATQPLVPPANIICISDYTGNFALLNSTCS